ncbi:MAG: site-2 protease family protein, partial [Candidatus Komeilibacteria bacterium]|nr:site-2 protease family protein [Candidatus Komeilibacteria bacterium]
TGQMAKLGFIYLLQFTALLSLNLAVINILPFPALDGGRIAFIGAEAARGRPASEKIEGVTHNIGFMLLLLLMVLVTFKDLSKYGDRIINVLTGWFT